MVLDMQLNICSQSSILAEESVRDLDFKLNNEDTTWHVPVLQVPRMT